MSLVANATTQAIINFNKKMESGQLRDITPEEILDLVYAMLMNHIILMEAPAVEQIRQNTLNLIRSKVNDEEWKAIEERFLAAAYQPKSPTTIMPGRQIYN